MLNLPMNIPGMTGMNAGDFFETNFMEDFDVFKPEGDINFERDFGQWFNSTEDGAGLELKP
jgi:collagen type III alpha